VSTTDSVSVVFVKERFGCLSTPTPLFVVCVKERYISVVCTKERFG